MYLSDQIEKIAKKLSSKIKVKSKKVLDKETKKLREMKKSQFKSRTDGTLNGSIISAAYNAMKHNISYYVYPGTSYMNMVWRPTYKESDALDSINNIGDIMYEVKPDLEVMQYSLDNKLAR